MAVRRFPVRTIAIVLVLALIAAVIAALIAPGADEGAGAQQLVRAEPQTEPFRGMGVWIDIYDEPAWAAPAGAVADMAANGVRTLYLQTSNADRPGSFVFPGGVEAFVDAAHDQGIAVVAWYLPHLTYLVRDRARVRDALGFTTARGDTFDGFALDIESDSVGDPTRRTERLVRLSNEIREEAGDDYPLGAVIPSPIRLRDDLAYWPGFPWRDLALTYDAILPMTYYTFRANGPGESFEYVAGSIDEIRARVGTDRVPIHVIGGLARDASESETLAFVRAVRDRRATGGSWYTWAYTTDEQWAVLQRIG
jgi:hypothetical protein